MDRREFKRIKESKLRHGHVCMDGFSGYAGVMEIISVTEPWMVKSSLGRVCIADAGYTWLQLSPDEGGWWLTVMYDPEGNLRQYYFDVTLENFVDEDGMPGFTDLYLDVVMNPGGSWVLLDRDELDGALKSGEITPDEHALAVKRSEKVISQIEGREDVWREICEKAMKMI